jgi:hypothetical protein
MYAGAQGIDDELGYADQDSSHSLIANAQYLLPIAHDYQVDILGVAPLLYVVLYAIRIVDVEEAAFGSSENLRVVRYGFAFGGSVDDREHLAEVLEDKLPSGQLSRCSVVGFLILCSIAPHFAPSS